eukprot:PhF_6_TR19610/c0_g1_i2/m.28613
MALNKVDTLQRAYNKLDAYSPLGHWVDEPSYNRQQRSNSSSKNRKVLVGNWQEETVQSGGNATTILGASLSANTNTTIADTSALSSTQRASYNEANSDISSQAPPPIGLRSQRRAAEITQLAVSKVKAYQEDTVRKNTSTTEEVFGSSYGDQFGRKSTEKKSIPDSIDHLTYVTDQPVTLYTGNPLTGSSMKVQGMTPSSSLPQRSKFARNNDFTTGVDKTLKQ